MEKNSGNLRGLSLLVGPTNGCPAFTLAELMVVIGVITLLTVTLLPALAQSKMKSQAVICLGHMRQLQRAALLYASDHNDDCPKNLPLAPSSGAGETPAKPCWVDGTFNSGFAADNPVGCSTNHFYLGVNGTTGFGVTLYGSIGPYVKSAKVYHCPADHYLDPTYHVLRVRSYSANLMIGCPLTATMGSNPTQYKAFEKYSDFGSPLAPSQCFEFLGENPLSLNDGWFDYALDGSFINDQPAANHDGAGSFSFADGHAALHVWQDVFLKLQSNLNQSGADTMWLAQHGTYKK